MMVDDEGRGLVSIAIQNSCGRQEMEEVVRAIVSRWGLDIGPNAGRDKGLYSMGAEHNS